MAIDFNKFSEAFPAEQMKKDMEEAKKNSDKLPQGDYRVKLDEMMLTENKSNKLMLKAQFRIQTGDHKNKCVFVNQVLCGTKNDGFMMLKAKEFLESLDSGLDIEFTGWEQFDQLVADVASAIQEDDLSFILNIKDDGDYQRYKIVEVIE